MSVHFDPDAPGTAREPVNRTTCGRMAGEGDTATRATAWITCPTCLASLTTGEPTP